MQKNVTGQKYSVFAFNLTTNAPVTGLTDITADLSKDGAAVVATNDTNPTETQDGYYDFNLLQAETNADKLNIYPVSATADVQVIGVPGAINPVSITVTLDTNQPNYTPAKAGDEMDLIDAPNATAVGVFTAGVWNATTRTLSSFGTIIADIWAHVTRTITGTVTVDNTAACKADVSGLATAAALTAVNDNVTSVGEDLPPAPDNASIAAIYALIEANGDGDVAAILDAAVAGLGMKHADVIYDITTDPAQGKLVYKHKTTGVVLLTQNIYQPDGSPFTDVTQLVGKLEDATL